MAPKRKASEPTFNAPPKTQKEHIFYGLQLDKEQENLRDSIWNPEKLIIFCDAKAGTGKTTIAVATANIMARYNMYEGIVYIVAPCNEDRIGMLPGGIDEKLAPYNTPLYQALTECGEQPEAVVTQDTTGATKNGEYILFTSHTYLRGTNFKDKIIIIDEAQNYSFFDLKKTLTRCKDSAKVILIGHSGQRDAHRTGESAFERYREHFRGDPRTAICTLTKNYRGWIASHADELG